MHPVFHLARPIFCRVSVPGKHMQSWKTHSVHSEILDDRNQHKQFPQNTNSMEGPEHCQSHLHLFSQVPEDPCYCRHGGGGRSPAVLRISVSMTLLLGKPLKCVRIPQWSSDGKIPPFPNHSNAFEILASNNTTSPAIP